MLPPRELRYAGRVSFGPTVRRSYIVDETVLEIYLTICWKHVAILQRRINVDNRFIYTIAYLYPVSGRHCW